MLFMTKAQLKYTSFGILTIFIKLIQTTPSDVEAFDLFFTPLYDIYYLGEQILSGNSLQDRGKPKIE